MRIGIPRAYLSPPEADSQAEPRFILTRLSGGVGARQEAAGLSARGFQFEALVLDKQQHLHLSSWERSRGCKGTLWKAASLLVQRVIGVPLWPHPLQSLGLGKSFYVTFSFLSGLMKECSCSHWDFCISFLLVIQVRLGWCSVMVGMGYIWFYWLSRLRRSFII